MDGQTAKDAGRRVANKITDNIKAKGQMRYR